MVTDGGKKVERGECVAKHGPEVKRGSGLVQSPERFGTIGVQLEKVAGLWLRELSWQHGRSVERPQEGQGVQPVSFQAGTETRWDGRRDTRQCPSMKGRSNPGKGDLRGGADHAELVRHGPSAVQQQETQRQKPTRAGLRPTHAGLA